MAGQQTFFVANRGQTDRQVAFYAQTPFGMTWITNQGGIVYSLPADMSFSSGLVLKEELVGGMPARVAGSHQTATKFNSFVGRDRTSWASNIPTYDLLDCGEIYPGIRLRLGTSCGMVEKLFSLAAGVDAKRIQIKVLGADGLQVTEAGELKVCTPLGSLTFSRPVAFQERADGEREFVEVAYAVENGHYGFAVGDYDRTRALVIDPLLSSTFLGGSGIDGDVAASHALIDPDGSVYVAGVTTSLDFPTTVGCYQDDFAGAADVTITKFDSALTTVLASTYLGSTNGEGLSYPGAEIVRGADGFIYVSGRTDGADFPVTANAYDVSFNGGADVFVAKLTADLSQVVAATFIGGTVYEYATTLTLDNTGAVIITGHSKSTDYPTTEAAYDRTHNGNGVWDWGGDIFVSKLSPDLSMLIASTFLGGAEYENSGEAAVDGTNRIWLVGTSGSVNFPTTAGAYDRSHSPGGTYFGDVIVSCLSSDLTQLVYSTFIGGNSDDWGYGIDLDASGNVYVSGHTAADDFPTTLFAYDREYNGTCGSDCGNDVFVSEFDPTISLLLASTYLGGSGWEWGNSLRCLDTAVIIVGSSGSADFPTTVGAFDRVYSGPGARWGEGIICRLSSDLRSLTASTYLGGSGQEELGSVVLDGHDNVCVSGTTRSSNFPTTAGAFDQTFNGGIGGFIGGDLFVTVLDLDWAFRDYDGDGLLNPVDNCVYAANPGQEDADLDNAGDACDLCPGHDDRLDADRDGVPDSCDLCPGYNDHHDADGDTVPDSCDNCPLVVNPDQADANSNGIGDACDCDCAVWGDVSGDGAINPMDVVRMVNFVYKSLDQRVQPPSCPWPAGDVDCSGQVNPMDVVRYVNYVYKSIQPFPCADGCNL